VRTLVQKRASTSSRPRSFTESPTASSPSPSTCERRPAATSTASTASVAPELSASRTGPRAGAEHDFTRSLNRNRTPSADISRVSRRGKFVVEEAQQLAAPVDQVHVRAERLERRGVLAPDHARADHRQPPRQPLKLEDLVRIPHSRVAEREFGRARRAAAGRDENEAAAQEAPRAAGCAARPVALARRRHFHDVRAHESRRSLHARHRTALDPSRDVSVRHPLHRALVPQEVGDVRCPPQRQVDRVQLAAAESRQRECRLTQRLARDRPRIDQRPAKIVRSLDQGDPLAEDTRSERRRKSGGAAADHDEVEGLTRFREAHAVVPSSTEYSTR
jgi:hypothetical protein